MWSLSSGEVVCMCHHKHSVAVPGELDKRVDAVVSLTSQFYRLSLTQQLVVDDVADTWWCRTSTTPRGSHSMESVNRIR